jgi:hypothetical protein
VFHFVQSSKQFMTAEEADFAGYGRGLVFCSGLSTPLVAVTESCRLFVADGEVKVYSSSFVDYSIPRAYLETSRDRQADEPWFVTGHKPWSSTFAVSYCCWVLKAMFIHHRIIFVSHSGRVESGNAFKRLISTGGIARRRTDSAITLARRSACSFPIYA